MCVRIQVNAAYRSTELFERRRVLMERLFGQNRWAGVGRQFCPVPSVETPWCYYPTCCKTWRSSREVREVEFFTAEQGNLVSLSQSAPERTAEGKLPHQGLGHLPIGEFTRSRFPACKLTAQIP